MKIETVNTNVNGAVSIADRLVAPVDEPSLERISATTKVVASAGLVAGTVESVLLPPAPLAGIVLSLCAAAAFLIRRTNPPLCLALLVAPVVLAHLVAILANQPNQFFTTASDLLSAVILYSLARHAPARTVYMLAFCALLIVPLGALFDPADPYNMGLLVEPFLLNAFMIGVGLVVRGRIAKRRRLALADKSHERDVIANDVHDHVAHHMSAIAIRAEAALQASSEAQMQDALRAIKKSATAGLTDMRHLVTELRDPVRESRSLPGLGDVRQLAVDATTPDLRITANVDVTLEVLPANVSAAVFAICREAITNVRLHSTDASQSAIKVSPTEHGLEILVTDNGTTVVSPTSAGHGISSMTERAEAVGGTLTAGSDFSGGWSVVAQIPIAALSQ